MQKFCHNCGKPTPTVEAKFCSYCGTSLSSLSATPTKQPAAPTFTPFAIDREDEDYDPIDRLTKLDIRINKLDVEIIKDRVVGETVAGYVQEALQGAKTVDDGFSRGAPPPVDSKEFLKEFQKEAGTARPDK
jgi:hypothetical protein